MLASPQNEWASAPAVHVVLAVALAAVVVVVFLRRVRGSPVQAPYSTRDFLTHEDLVDRQVRANHLAFNEHLHQRFSGQKFVPVQGEDGCFVAFDYTTCKEIMNDHTCFSSNPFQDGRLVALNTMSKADHTRVLRAVHSHFKQEEIERMETELQALVERCTAELGESGDAMRWAKRIHMASTLLRLGVRQNPSESWSRVDEVVHLNDAMVALVAPLGGVGKKYETVPLSQVFCVLIGLLRSILPTLAMLRRLGFQCTWEIIRPDVTVFWPPKRPRMGLWWRPDLLPLVPQYFLSLQDLLEGPAAVEGPLSGIQSALAKGELRLAEALTLMVQLMVNMTSANALGNLVYRLGTEKEVAQKVFADPDGFIGAFVQEVLRLDAPLQRNPRRVVQTSGKWAGSQLRAGDQVLLFLGAANMDPAVFEQPEKFRLDRADKAVLLTFGSGMHYCLGSHLVKLEMRLALRCLLRHYQWVELGSFNRLTDVDVGNWGFTRLQVELKPRDS